MIRSHAPDVSEACSRASLPTSLLSFLTIRIAVGITYGIGIVAQAYFESDMKMDKTEHRETFLEEDCEAKKQEWKPVKAKYPRRRTIKPSMGIVFSPILVIAKKHMNLTGHVMCPVRGKGLHESSNDVVYDKKLSSVFIEEGLTFSGLGLNYRLEQASAYVEA